MALTSVAIGARDANIPLDHVGLVPVSFLGDGAYPSGGTLLFSAITAIKAALRGRKIIGIVPGDCGGYTPVYLPATDALKVEYGNNDGVADGPRVENATADLSGVTFNLLLVVF